MIKLDETSSNNIIPDIPDDKKKMICVSLGDPKHPLIWAVLLVYDAV